MTPTFNPTYDRSKWTPPTNYPTIRRSKPTAPHPYKQHPTHKPWHRPPEPTAAPNLDNKIEEEIKEEEKQIEKVAKDPTAEILAAVLVTLAVLGMLTVAYQVLENPDGLCARYGVKLSIQFPLSFILLFHNFISSTNLILYMFLVLRYFMASKFLSSLHKMCIMLF